MSSSKHRTVYRTYCNVLNEVERNGKNGEKEQNLCPFMYQILLFIFLPQFFS